METIPKPEEGKSKERGREIQALSFRESGLFKGLQRFLAKKLSNSFLAP